jgi:hypothetical protein
MKIQTSYLQVAGFWLITASRPERSAGNNLEFAEKYKWSDNNSSIIAIEGANPLTLHLYFGLQEGNNNMSILFSISWMNF